MNRNPIDSTNIRSIGYDPGTGQMECEFSNGRIYRYDAVPKILHDGLVAARSTGVFFNNRIKNRFKSIELAKEK